MKIVRSVNRSWIYDSYFSLHRPIHPGEMSGGEMSGGLSEYRRKGNAGANWVVLVHMMRIQK